MSGNYSTFRVGIVGAGLMGRWHAKNVTRLGAQIVSILDHDPSRAKRLSVELGGDPRVFTSVDDMMTGPNLDIVHICTPLEYHYPIAMLAIEAGVHVIVEKPMATTVLETETLLEAARKRGVKLCPVHQFGFQDGVQDAIDRLDSLGDLLHLRFTTGSAGGEGRNDNDLNKIIANIIPHPISILQRLRPGTRLDISQWSSLHSRDGELLIIGQADGIAIDIYISMNARPTRCEMELFCSKGRIYLNFFHGYSVIERGRVSRVQKMIQPFRFTMKEFLVAGVNISKRGWRRELAYPGLYRLIEEFYKAVKAGEAPPVATAEALDVAIAREELTRRILPDMRERSEP